MAASRHAWDDRNQETGPRAASATRPARPFLRGGRASDPRRWARGDLDVAPGPAVSRRSVPRLRGSAAIAGAPCCCWGRAALMARAASPGMVSVGSGPAVDLSYASGRLDPALATWARKRSPRGRAAHATAPRHLGGADTPLPSRPTERAHPHLHGTAIRRTPSRHGVDHSPFTREDPSRRLACRRSSRPRAGWRSCDRALAGDHFVPRAAVLPGAIGDLAAIRRYDLGRQTSSQTGPIMLDGTTPVVTDFEMIALDGAACPEIRRATEDHEPAQRRPRGDADGRAHLPEHAARPLSGSRRRDRRGARRRRGSGRVVPTAVIALSRPVLAGDEDRGVEVRMHALNAESGEVVRERYPVPREADGPSCGPNAPVPPANLAATWGDEDGVPIAGGAIERPARPIPRPACSTGRGATRCPTSHPTGASATTNSRARWWPSTRLPKPTRRTTPCCLRTSTTGASRRRLRFSPPGVGRG